MEELLTVIYTILAAQNHTPSINELDNSEYYGRAVKEIDYQICRVEVPIDHPYLQWELIPNAGGIVDALVAHDTRMEREHRASAYLYTAGELVSVIKVERGRGDWSSQDVRDERREVFPVPRELWVIPYGEEFLNILYSRGASQMRDLIEYVEEVEEESEEQPTE